jgi:Uma2 family endonuclease
MENAMKTLLKLGPGDKGRSLSWEEFRSAHYQEGFRYELIEGKLYVSPHPNVPHDILVEWLKDLLKAYARSHPTLINYVSGHPRVFVLENEEITAPEPDLAAYPDYPSYANSASIRWSDLNPVLVAEVVSQDDPEKDLVRNVELYRQVASIREYWILDPRSDAGQLQLIVYRRGGQSWQKPMIVDEGETYTARCLPGFSLILDPSQG